MAIKKLAPSLVRYLSILPDPRKEKNRKHLLIDIIVIALCTCLADGECWTDCEDFGHANEKWLRQFLSLPYGIPSHDVFREVFMRLDPEQLSQVLTQWISEVRSNSSLASVNSGSQHIAIDGKTLRGSVDRANEKTPFHMISAWVSELGISMGQIAVGEKSNEIIAVPKLLKTLNLKGTTVTLDAMGCQKRIAAQIIRQGGDYVFTVKKNQTKLYEQIDDFFKTAEKHNFEDVEFERFETIEKDHGRIERRIYIQVSDLSWLEKNGWTGLKAVGMVIRKIKKNGHWTTERAYHIMSFTGDAKKYAKVVRNHWGVENQLHWRLDVIFNEDNCRMRVGLSAKNFAVLRRLAIGILNRDTTKGLSMRRKRLKAAWSTKYLENLIFG